MCFVTQTSVFSEEMSCIGSNFVDKLKSFADQLDYYPLECHVFPAAQIALRLNTTEISTYFEFTSLARNAAAEDRESCIAYLDDATSKERALILVVLFFSQDNCYLPLISKYLSDREVAFAGTCDDVVETVYDKALKRNMPLPRTWAKAPESTYMRKKWRKLTDNSAGFDELDFNPHRPITVSSFATIILGNWGCFPSSQTVQQWMAYAVTNQFSPEHYEFYHHKKLMRSWYIKYLVEVCSFPIESYEQKIKDFLEEMKKLPPRDCILVFWRINASPYSRFTSGDLLLTKGDHYQGYQYLFLQDWRFPYKEIPKEELIELLTMKNLGEIDEWLDKSVYDSIVSDILKRRDWLFEKEEFEEFRPRFNDFTREYFECLEKHQ